mmetsp:Transcript_36539/g.91107  ORF Transcript_36539/g.91107 Transcript_36539/m.91107 type:complete len:171 (-) Transcript_36539:503-1015(-)
MQPPAYPTGAPPASQMYNVMVPAGVGPGETFQASVNGVLMNVVCPTGCSSGMEVQISGPPSASTPPPLASGYPDAVYPPQQQGPSYSSGPVYNNYSQSAGPGGYGNSGYNPNQPIYGAQGMAYSQQGMVEETVVSPLGWFICIVGCFICPPCNLLGLCLQERRLVPISRA